MKYFLTKQQAKDLDMVGHPDVVIIQPDIACETEVQNLHRLLEQYREKLETNINKNSKTALHRILLN